MGMSSSAPYIEGVGTEINHLLLLYSVSHDKAQLPESSLCYAEREVSGLAKLGLS